MSKYRSVQPYRWKTGYLAGTRSYSEREIYETSPEKESQFKKPYMYDSHVDSERTYTTPDPSFYGFPPWERPVRQYQTPGTAIWEVISQTTFTARPYTSFSLGGPYNFRASVIGGNSDDFLLAVPYPFGLTNPEYLYFWTSLNGGVTWNEVAAYQSPAFNDFSTTIPRAFAYSTGLFAGCFHEAPWLIIYSTDFGNNWTTVSPGANIYLPGYSDAFVDLLGNMFIAGPESALGVHGVNQLGASIGLSKGTVTSDPLIDSATTAINTSVYMYGDIFYVACIHSEGSSVYSTCFYRSADVGVTWSKLTINRVTINGLQSFNISMTVVNGHIYIGVLTLVNVGGSYTLYADAFDSKDDGVTWSQKTVDQINNVSTSFALCFMGVDPTENTSFHYSYVDATTNSVGGNDVYLVTQEQQRNTTAWYENSQKVYNYSTRNSFSVGLFKSFCMTKAEGTNLPIVYSRNRLVS